MKACSSIWHVSMSIFLIDVIIPSLLSFKIITCVYLFISCLRWCFIHAISWGWFTDRMEKNPGVKFYDCWSLV